MTLLYDIDFNTFCKRPYKEFRNVPENEMALCFTKETSEYIFQYIGEYKAKAISLAKRKKLTIIFDNSYLKYKDLLDIANAQMLYIDWFAIDVYRKQYIEKINQPLKFRKPEEGNKFLCLVGKPHKEHRIRTIFHLWKQDLLKHCKLSFRFNGLEHFCKPLIPNVDDEQWQKFVDESQNDLDIRFPKSEPFHYTGIPFNPEIYKNVSFQFVIESEFKPSHPWLTEKTWLPIVNQKPFIMLGGQHEYDRLEELGFDPYKEFLIYPNFYKEKDLSKRIRKAARNIEHWVQNLHKYDIEKTVLHNYETYLKLVEKNVAEINACNLGVDPYSVGVPYSNMRKIKPIKEYKG